MSLFPMMGLIARDAMIGIYVTGLPDVVLVRCCVIAMDMLVGHHANPVVQIVVPTRAGLPVSNCIAVLYCTVIIKAQTPTAKAPVPLLTFGRSSKTQLRESNTQMGSLCSKSSNLTGGHTLISSTDAQPRASAGRPSQPPQNAEARRSQAAEAAERRMQAVSTCRERSAQRRD
jgi:hypothetical protein